MEYPFGDQGDNSSSDEDDFIFSAGTVLLFGPHSEEYGGPIQKVPDKARLSGREWLAALMSGRYTRIMDATRLTVDSFLKLCNKLARAGFFPQHHQKHVTIEEALAMTLIVMSHNDRMRIIVLRFDHSLETVHQNIREVLRGLVIYAREVITPRGQHEVHPKILNDDRFHPWFENAVGAMDGTHIPACVPANQQVAYTNRHGRRSQNVLVVYDHDMRFVYVYVGWEGSAHDARVLEDALLGPNHFPMPPPGKYYLVDSAYRIMPGFLPLYRGCQADLSGQRRGRFATKKELFNYRHSSLRNVIERSFGLLKKRFKVLKGEVPNYMLGTQVNIVLACCAVHNFIRDEHPDEDLYDNDAEESTDHTTGVPAFPNVQPLHSTQQQIQQWTAFRDNIAKDMFAQYLAGLNRQNRR